MATQRIQGRKGPSMSEPVDYLEHFGVKGMKWGKTSSKSSKSSKDSKGSEPKTSSDFKKVEKTRKKKPSEMSNEELKVLNERMNLEQNYARLNPNKLVKGRNIVAGIIGTVGMGVTVYNMYNGPAGKAAIAKGKEVKAKLVK